MDDLALRWGRRATASCASLWCSHADLCTDVVLILRSVCDTHLLCPGTMPQPGTEHTEYIKEASGV